MTHGSLFSGIGGFDLASEWMGWENKFHCEINPFGRQTLHYYWPNATSYEDIKTTDFTIWRGLIDILTGGFPCQPYSTAGKRLGKEDERHLWPEMLRAIREISPRWVVGENVRGLISWNGGMIFDEVQADLEAEGYEVLPFLLPAAGVNAPHRRDRIWFVAHRTDAGVEGVRKSEIGIHEPGTITNTLGNGSIKGCEKHQSEQFDQNGKKRIIADTRCRLGDWRKGSEDGSIINWENAGRQKEADFTERLQKQGDATNTQGQGLSRETRVQNEATRRLALCCKPNVWDDFPTQPPVRSRNDGVPSGLVGITVSKHRNESLKAYGNAIVPQVAYQIFKAIEQYEKLNQ